MARVWPSLAGALPRRRADTQMMREVCGAGEAGIASCLIITHVFKTLRAPAGVRPGDLSNPLANLHTNVKVSDVSLATVALRLSRHSLTVFSKHLSRLLVANVKTGVSHSLLLAKCKLITV